MWIALSITSMLVVTIQVSCIKVLGFTFGSWSLYNLISICISSWMIILAYKFAPSYFQVYFLQTACLAIFGWLASLLYFKEVLNIKQVIGAVMSLVGALLLIL